VGNKSWEGGGDVTRCCIMTCGYMLNRKGCGAVRYEKLTRSPSSLLPKSCKIYASAGAGFDWVDTKTMAEHGTASRPSLLFPLAHQPLTHIPSRHHLLQLCLRLHRIRSRRSNRPHPLRLSRNPVVLSCRTLWLLFAIYRRKPKHRRCDTQP
jgi:hypothetical protein